MSLEDIAEFHIYLKEYICLPMAMEELEDW